MDRVQEIKIFQKACFSTYLNDIRTQVTSIPDSYVYPDGNPVRPVVPTKTYQNNIMIIGAFPSARFERRNKVLIPVGDNLSPFGHEEYFDGLEVRTQASRDSLDKSYFPQLGLDINKLWITDIVKVYLFPEKHIKNCKLISPEIQFVNTHALFQKIAIASMTWMRREIEICNPRLIITLGEVAARVITGNKTIPSENLLNGEIKQLILDKKYNIAHLAHPEIRRINKKWDGITKKAISKLQMGIERVLR